MWSKMIVSFVILQQVRPLFGNENANRSKVRLDLLPILAKQFKIEVIIHMNVAPEVVETWGRESQPLDYPSNFMCF